MNLSYKKDRLKAKELYLLELRKDIAERVIKIPAAYSQDTVFKHNLAAFRKAVIESLYNVLDIHIDRNADAIYYINQLIQAELKNEKQQ